MLKGIITISKYMIIAIFFAILYGYAAYTVIYQNLADGSMLYAYLWNIIFIIALLILDKVIHARMQSREFVITKRNYIFALWMHIENFVSFKTTLYLFYIFVIIASRVSMIDPTLLNDEFRGFVLSIEYSLILVIAFDKLMEHLYKDIGRTKTMSDKFKGYKSSKPKKRP